MNNVALNKAATSSSYVSPFAPGKAVDGTLTPLSRWLCDRVCTETPGRLQVDLGAPYWINRWIVKHMATVGWPANYVNAEFYLQGSMDNANWFTMDTISDNTLSTTDRTIAPMQARYVKLSVTSGLRSNKGVASIVDLQIIESDYNPYLVNLTISSGTLSPAFNPKVFPYTDQVGSEVVSVTVTPTAQASTSAIKVNNVAVTSGHASQPITLQDGNNYITVAVTNGPITQSYTTVVTKLSDSGYTYLSNLVLNGPRGTIAIAPSFDKNIFEYNAYARTAASVTVTPSVEKPGSTVKVNDVDVVSGQPSQAISLSQGSNTVTIQVTHEGGGSPTLYKLYVTKS
ncbi:MAG: cadherin-like beta sandwich domain-containing protein [Desulfosporosinus sp.]|nr:cadherin-like beta sandwich domain-containing protein [Desulfosporosinus sp.]